MGEHLYIKVQPKKCTLKLGNCVKLAPQFSRPFEILTKVGPMAYYLALQTQIKVHNVFNVSLLKNNIHALAHVINWNVV